MSNSTDVRTIDVIDESGFARVPPCMDGRFDHRSCDYWEDEVRGSKHSRPSWWQEGPAPTPRERRTQVPDNPFAPAPPDEEDFNPFAATSSTTPPGLAADDVPSTAADFNPFAPASRPRPEVGAAGPRKLRLLSRGLNVFGSYAKTLLVDSEPAVYVQFGPLSAYPRAQHIRELYPRLPQSPLPAVITCIASTERARGRGLAVRLVQEVCADLSTRGFSAVEAYPDLTLGPDESSSADPRFWRGCGFEQVAEDERFPVMRRELD